MHAPRRTQARSTAESRIDNIIELPRFLATVVMLRLTSLASNNCFILTRNSSVIVGIVIVVQARFIISDGQGKYQTKSKQRMRKLLVVHRSIDIPSEVLVERCFK